jgi:alkylation response protein AidB-like acyl-CoA dehydrogenase
MSATISTSWWRRRFSAIRARGAGVGPGPRVRAVECEGGYRVTGVWSFASGGRHATWLGAHCPIHAADGSPKYDANGVPLERTMLVRSEDVEWTDIWNTVGLRGPLRRFAQRFPVRADHRLPANSTGNAAARSAVLHE